MIENHFLFLAVKKKLQLLENQLTIELLSVEKSDKNA